LRKTGQSRRPAPHVFSKVEFGRILERRVLVCLPGATTRSNYENHLLGVIALGRPLCARLIYLNRFAFSVPWLPFGKDHAGNLIQLFGK
jgi:hypothetical protein